MGVTGRVTYSQNIFTCCMLWGGTDLTLHPKHHPLDAPETLGFKAPCLVQPPSATRKHLSFTAKSDPWPKIQTFMIDPDMGAILGLYGVILRLY